MGSQMIMKKTKVIFDNYILIHDIKIDNEVIECVQEYIYPRQKNWCMSRL